MQQSMLFGAAVVVAFILKVTGSLGVRAIFEMLLMALGAAKAFEIAYFLKCWFTENAQDEN